MESGGSDLLLNNGTLAGSKISSDKPIAVTISEDCINSYGQDLAGDQLVPIDMVGTRYVVVRGYSDYHGSVDSRDRIDFVATESNTVITVYYYHNEAISSISFSPALGAGETWHETIPKIGAPKWDTSTSATAPRDSDVVFVQATKPVYCYQHSADGGEFGAALIPSMYSISQRQIDFFQSSAADNCIFLVYLEGDEPIHNVDSFYISFDGGTPDRLTSYGIVDTIITGDIPFPSGINDNGGWQFAKIRLNDPTLNRMVTITNNRTPFSLGYFSGSRGGTSAYGYLSGFGSFKFDLDTMWRCLDGQCVDCGLSTTCTTNPQFNTGLFIAESWKWTRDGELLGQAPYDTIIEAVQSGKYVVEVYQDPFTIKDSCYVLDMVFDTDIYRLPQKPAKVTVPQLFRVDCGQGRSLPSGVATNRGDPGVYYKWSLEGGGGTFVSSDTNPDFASIVWSTTGYKEVKLQISATGVGCMTNGVKNNKTCDTTLVYPVLVHEKNLGFFVDQNVPYDNEHNGTGWDNAFPTLQQALALASQGDYIWMADGDYSPRDSFPAGVDSADVYTGYYMLDYDSVRIYTGSYVMDWDSVQVFGGFSGYGENAETNLNERDINAFPVVLHGSDDKSPVIKIDGSTVYTHLDPQGTLRGVSRAARWDGVTVRDGRAENGAGILFENGASGTVSNSIVRSNAATSSGGGIYVEATAASSQPPLFYGVEISGNTAVNGAGIYNAGSNMMLLNVTVGGNLASSRGGGLYSTDGGMPVIRNSIVYGNRAGVSGGDVQIAGGTPSWTNSDAGGSKPDMVWNASYGTDGGNNIDMDPGFVMPGFDSRGNMVEGNYRLRSQGRKTVDGGYNNFLRIAYPVSIVLLSPSPRNTVYGDYLDRDLAGDERIIYDNVDMGAYEQRGTPILPERVYRVEVPEVEGAVTVPPPGVYYLPAHQDFTFRLTPREDHTLAYAEVTTGSVWQDERGYMEVTEEADGAKTYVFHDVVDQLKIRVTGVIPSGVGEAEAMAIWAESGRLYVQTPSEVVLRVYTLTGRLQLYQTVQPGRTSVSLPAGMYIVAPDGGMRQRVIIF
jgi:hypothetical protein